MWVVKSYIDSMCDSIDSIAIAFEILIRKKARDSVFFNTKYRTENRIEKWKSYLILCELLSDNMA